MSETVSAHTRRSGFAVRATSDQPRSGNASWARVVGILVASVNLLFQFAYLGHYPFWSFTMIVIDILIIYGLAGHRPDELEQA